jgi:NAD(P)H-flavin reductase
MSYLIRPMLKEEIKPVIKYCLENKKEDDKIYVYYGAKKAFDYYTWDSKIEILPSVDKTRETPEEYIKDLERLKGTGRVWFIFSHIYQNEEKLYLTYLNHIALKIDSLQSKGASVYLYEL